MQIPFEIFFSRLSAGNREIWDETVPNYPAIFRVTPAYQLSLD